jgi:hypothetical protein
MLEIPRRIRALLPDAERLLERIIMSKQNIDSRVFSLASNLFGYGSTTEKKIIQEAIATTVATTLQKENRIFAVYPALVVEAFALTMDNYRSYIHAYNFKTEAENELTEIHNATVKSYLKENTLTETQKTFSEVFIHKSKSLSPRAYNENADAFMKDYGLIIEKKKVQLVKYATELVFQNLLHLYNSQLMKRNEQYMKLGITSPRPIQEFKINSFLVTELKRNGINSIDLCKKTVRNHRQRLEECGVFVEYAFKGQNRPVEVHINPEILTVLDLKTSKLTTAENQCVIPANEKVLLDNNESTRTSLNEFQMNENVKNISQDKEFPLVTPSYLFFTGTPSSNKQNPTEGGAPKSVKVLETLSDKLQNLIIHPQELAVNLANKEYNNYTPIDIRILHKEAYNGTMLKEDFRELIIQDFFKTISKIYKNSTPYAGSWKKAINFYMLNKFIAFTGDAFNKQSIVDDIQQLRWRIEWARKWFIKNKEVNPLFPADYFDMTRKTSKEVGFEYTKAKWSEHLLGKAKYEVLKKKREADAVRRKETINHSKKCENEVNRFFKNKITLPQLFDYVQNNLPKEYLEKLPQMIEKKTLNMNRKTVFDDDFLQYNLSEF